MKLMLVALMAVACNIVSISASCNVSCSSCFGSTCYGCYSGSFWNPFIQDYVLSCTGSVDYSSYAYGGAGVCYDRYGKYHIPATLIEIIVPIASIVACISCCICVAHSRAQRIVRNRQLERQRHLTFSPNNREMIVVGIPDNQEVSLGYPISNYQPGIQQIIIPQHGDKQQHIIEIQKGYPIQAENIEAKIPQNWDYVQEGNPIEGRGSKLANPSLNPVKDVNEIQLQK